MDSSSRRLMAIQSVLALANATAGVFTIVFLLKIDGFPIRDLVLFSLISFALAVLVCVALVHATPRRSDSLMVLGLLILASSYAAYLFMRGWSLLIYVGFAWGLYIPLFFVPFNTLVVATTRADDRARKIGGFVLAYTAVAILAPTLGGAVVESAGYPLVFSFAALVLLANCILILRLRLGREPLDLALELPRLGRGTAIALFAEGGFEGLSFGVVPLLAYLFTQDELGIGELFSLFALAGAFITLLLGVASDRMRDRRPFLVLGAFATATATSLVASATSLPTLALGNSVVSLVSPIAPLFLMTLAVERIPERPANAMVTREMLLNGGRTVSLALFIVLLSLGIAPSHGFILAGIFAAVAGIAGAWKGLHRRASLGSI